jgi:hypothetical protein
MVKLADAGLRPIARRLRLLQFCHGKRRHLSQGAAQAAIRSLVRRALQCPDRGELNTYRCPRCLAWHVGHRTTGARAPEEVA